MLDTFPLLARPPDPSVPTVASDLEGTLTAGVTVLAIHRYLEAHDRKADSRTVYRRWMPRYMVRRVLRMGLRTVKNDWMRDLIRQFKGRDAGEIGRLTDWLMDTAIWSGRRRQVVAELEAHLQTGRRVVIVSGMSTPILQALLDKLPGMEAIGTRVLPGEDGFSGELEAEFNVGRRKVERLAAFAEPDGRIHAAYGDTFSDLPMLELSRNPAAVAPDRKLRRAALQRGWRMIEG